MDNENLSQELQEKLDDVEKSAKSANNSRFNFNKGTLIGLLCLGLFFTFGIAMRAGLFNALGFGIVGGIVGFCCGICPRPAK